MQLLLFDLDGTLVRTGGAGVQAMNQAYAEIMHWENALESISMAGRTDPSIAHELARQHLGRNMTPEELEGVFNRYLQLLQKYILAAPTFCVLPGIREFLKNTHGQPDRVAALGTGNLETGARIKLARADLNQYLPFGGFGSDAVDRAQVLRVAVSRAENRFSRAFQPREVIVIGDTPHDIAAGRKIGARTIAVATGPFSTDQLGQQDPDLVLESFSDQTRLDTFLSQLI